LAFYLAGLFSPLSGYRSAQLSLPNRSPSFAPFPAMLPALLALALHLSCFVSPALRFASLPWYALWDNAYRFQFYAVLLERVCRSHPAFCPFAGLPGTLGLQLALNPPVPNPPTMIVGQFAVVVFPRLLAVQESYFFMVCEAKRLDYFWVVGDVVRMVGPFSAAGKCTTRRCWHRIALGEHGVSLHGYSPDTPTKPEAPLSS
jgi:hypothetical protein